MCSDCRWTSFWCLLLHSIWWWGGKGFHDTVWGRVFYYDPFNNPPKAVSVLTLREAPFDDRVNCFCNENAMQTGWLAFPHFTTCPPPFHMSAGFQKRFGLDVCLMFFLGSRSPLLIRPVLWNNFGLESSLNVFHMSFFLPPGRVGFIKRPLD